MPSEHTICVVVTDELKRKIEAEAGAKTITKSAVVRQALMRYFLPRNVRTANVKGEQAIA